jgi:NAD(P)-dependent dehydrogenase (short-subunit alcohol dehydrogenase family)
VAALFEKAEATFGRLDVLFNNAGIGSPRMNMEDLPVGDWQRVVDTNLTGSFVCAQHAIRIMKNQTPQGGRIINNGSISAHTPRPDAVAYTATKHAVTGLTKQISLDGRKYNIACSQVDVGNAATPMTARMQGGALQANGQTMPEPTFNVDHVGETVLYISNLPLDANIQFVTIMATQMPYVGRG